MFEILCLVADSKFGAARGKASKAGPAKR
jgi:hypothetical protein